MEHLPTELLVHIVSHLDLHDILALNITCTKFNEKSVVGYTLWKQAFLDYSNPFGFFKKTDYFEHQNNSYPPWYIPNKSHLSLLLFLKEIERRKAIRNNHEHFVFPFFVSQENSTDAFWFIITPNGNFLQLYMYFCTSSEEAWMILKQVNSKNIFLPLFGFQYRQGQWGSRWRGSTIPNVVRTFIALLELQRESYTEEANYKLLTSLILTAPEIEKELSHPRKKGWETFLWAVTSPKYHTLEAEATENSVRDALLKYKASPKELQAFEERSLRIYEKRAKERWEEERRRILGPATQEEHAVWNKLNLMAEAGHKDATFKSEWDELFAAVKNFPREHQEHFVRNNIKGDSWHTFLWNSAKRGWTNECAWALCLGADPFYLDGGRSAYAAAKYHNRIAVVRLFDKHSKQ